MSKRCTAPLCGSERIARVQAKCSDACSFEALGNEMVGYPPLDAGIGGGDYIRFSYCLQCGQIQGNFPVTPDLG